MLPFMSSTKKKFRICLGVRNIRMIKLDVLKIKQRLVMGGVEQLLWIKN